MIVACERNEVGHLLALRIGDTKQLSAFDLDRGSCLRLKTLARLLSQPVFL
jgi:hypothetical protein